MKLSEAMQKGCEQHPSTKHCFFFFHISDPNMKILGTCVLGAAYVGTFGTPDIGREPVYVNVIRSLTEQYPLLRQSVKHPHSDRNLPLAEAIMALADSHDWSRERIIEWVEHLEYQFKID